jgi:hypothetical protein
VRGMGNPFLDHPTLWLGTREGALGVRGCSPLICKLGPHTHQGGRKSPRGTSEKV